MLWIILIELDSCYQVATCSCTWLTQIVDRLKCLRGIMRVNIYCTRKPWVKIKQYTCNTYQNYSIRLLAHAEYEHWILGTDTLESIPPGLGTFWKKYKVDTGSTYLLTKNVLISENLFVIWALPFLACHKNNVSLFVSFWRNTDRYFGINSFDVCGGVIFESQLSSVRTERTELREQRENKKSNRSCCLSLRGHQSRGCWWSCCKSKTTL